MPAPGIMSSENPNWRTPPSLFEPLQVEFRFDLDAAADPKSHLLDRWLGPGSLLAENALAADDWSHFGTRAWLNPPYSRKLRLQIEPWLNAASRQTIPVVALVPARVDTAWWHRIVMTTASEIRLIEGRVNFIHPETGLPGTGGTFPSALVIWAHRFGKRRPPIVVPYSQSTAY